MSILRKKWRWKLRKDRRSLLLLKRMVPVWIVIVFIRYFMALAFCGGNCHCGGCHIKMSQGITDLLPKMSEQEKETLKKGIDVDERYWWTQVLKSSSRLACQTKVMPCMEGRVIVVPLAIWYAHIPSLFPCLLVVFFLQLTVLLPISRSEHNCRMLPEQTI
mgnify:CR=1